MSKEYKCQPSLVIGKISGTFHKKAVFICLVWAATFHVSAQNGSYDLRNIITPSPTTASLGKYGEIPVSLYTGIPNISIPLYEIRDGSLSVPISLSYHAGGIKVEEIASSVGLGWTLNAGGVVGRQQRGAADEYGGWITSPESRIASILQSGSQGQINMMTLAVENGSKDGEADIYYYNFNGHSGKFFFDQAGTLHNYPATNVSISPQGGGFYGYGWKIITEDGTVYEFDKAEIVTSISCTGGDAESTTAWYLSRITSSDGKRQINFEYEAANYSVAVFLGETKYFPLNGFGGCLNSPQSACSGNNVFSTFRLTRINYSGGYVKFVYNNERQDISYLDKSLDQVEVYNSGDNLIKRYALAYSYFVAGSTPDHKRLKLTSVTETSDTNNPKPPYAFTYEEGIEMPHRLSMSVDHWGYYNGKINTSHIATFEILNPITGLPLIFYGADRNANPATMQACILKKIKYPTGGETEFTYESNTTWDPRISPATYDQYFHSSLNQTYSSLSSPYETASFTIPSQGADVEFSVSGIANSSIPCNYEVNLRCYLIKDNNTSTPYQEITDDSNGLRRKLPAGVYKFRFTFESCVTGSLNYSINLHKKIPILSELGKRPVGGLRVKQIMDTPGEGSQPIVRKYRYESDIDPTQSSGMLINYPEYGYILNAQRYQGGTYAGEPCTLAESCVYWAQQSKTNYPLASSQGSFVGYYYVVEDYEDNGETHHRYNVYPNANPPFPFAPLEYSEWQLGSELYTKYYARKNGQLVLSKEITYGYTSIDRGVVKGYKVGRDNISTGTCGTLSMNAPLTIYDIRPQFWALGRTTERTYDQNNPSGVVESEVNYTYDPNHFQVTQIRSSASGGDPSFKEEIVVNKKYAQDNTFDGSSLPNALQGIQKLRDLHVVNVPVEEYSYTQKRNVSNNNLSDQRIVGGTITTFRTDNPYPDKIYQLKLNEPIALTDFNAYTSAQKSLLYEPRINFLSYGSRGNLLSQQKTSDAVVSYLWGYNSTLPIAEVKNATNASSSAQFPVTKYGSAEITTYVGLTAILPSFEITSSQQLSVTVGLLGAGTSLPSSPYVNLVLLRANGTTVSDIIGVWGQNTYSISVGPGVYQWYYSTGDIFFSQPEFTSVYLSVSNTYSVSGTGSRIFYTSFEDEGNYATKAYTGSKSWYGQYTLYLPAQNGSYQLSYMKWNGSNPGSWEYITVPVSVTSGTVQSLTIGNATSIIDEVRLYPSGALMTTYSYKPELGITAIADPNCVVTYYEYDSFGRLNMIKDDKGNIMKQYDYHYKAGN